MKRLARVHRWLGPLSWYMDKDHLLAADQNGFTVRYRRVYFADLRSVLIWPNQQLWPRLGIEALLVLVPAVAMIWLRRREMLAAWLGAGLLWM
ncbi:MAG: hypothetical protein ACRD1E_04885, partial [Terriglobales bacterium]